MSKIFVEDYLQKLSLLENQAGSHVGYKILEPFAIRAFDSVDLNSAAKRIAEFVGIRKLTIVAVTEHSPEVAGHTELQRNSSEIYIEIAQDLLSFPLGVLETLAHEISHQFLHSLNISWGSKEEHHYHNEVMTDICAVFLGFGKLMLNGAESKRVRHETRGNGRIEITESRKVGYLDREQMAFVYRLVCAMRRIPATVYEPGLTPEALVAVRNAEGAYSRTFFDSRFHSDETIEESLQSLKEYTDKVWDELHGLRSDLVRLQKEITQPMSEFLARANERIEILSPKAKITKQQEEYDPALRFLNRLQLLPELDRSKQEIVNFQSEVTKHRKTIVSLLESAASKSIEEPATATKVRNFFKRAIGKTHEK